MTLSNSETEDEKVIKVDQNLTCPYPNCDKTFSRPSRLKAHEFSHTGEKPFKCHCGKAYARSFHLQRHMKTHQPIQDQPKKPVLNCSDCGAQFANR